MTERDFYKRILRPRLHNPPKTQVFRVEDYGMPDVMVAHQNGITFYELKVLDHFPVRDSTPFRIKYTTEQKRTLQSINDAVGADIAFFMVAVAREEEFYLFTPDVPREIPQDEVDEYAVLQKPFDFFINGGNNGG